MTKFNPRPVAADAARIAQGVASLPLTTPPRELPEPPASRRAPPVVQINFKATEEFADLLAELAVPHGGLRRYLAHLVSSAGHAVPAADINPPTTKRRGQGRLA